MELIYGEVNPVEPRLSVWQRFESGPMGSEILEIFYQGKMKIQGKKILCF